jgi:hypothetical protein
MFNPIPTAFSMSFLSLICILCVIRAGYLWNTQDEREEISKWFYLVCACIGLSAVACFFLMWAGVHFFPKYFYWHMWFAVREVNIFSLVGRDLPITIGMFLISLGIAFVVMRWIIQWRVPNVAEETEFS